MVEDSEIKTTVSPFSIRSGEIKTFDGKDGYVSINQIIHKINLGQITDIHFEILYLINEFEFMTSRQIFQMLVYKGVDIKSQDKLNNKLDQLVKNKILTRYYFSSEEGKGIYRVYCLEKMGKYLLNSREKDCDWQPTDNTKPVALIKKRLAGNQVVIAYIRKSKNLKSYVAKPKINAKMLGKVFKSHGKITVGKGGKSIDIIFECVRREKDWEKHFSDKHMVETFKQIISNNLNIESIVLYFTTDLKQNDEALGKSLIKFVKDEKTGKYKVVSVDFKILD